MGALTTYPNELWLPRVFVEDHYNRGLDTGYNPRWTGANRVWIRATDKSLAEIESDARHYATDVDMAPKEIIASARRTVAAIEKHRAGIAVRKHQAKTGQYYRMSKDEIARIVAEQEKGA